MYPITLYKRARSRVGLFLISNSAHATSNASDLHHFLQKNSRPILGKEIQHRLVTPRVLLLDALVRQVAAGGHPAVDLVLEGLDVLGALEVRLELLDLVVGLLLGGEHDQRDLDRLSFLGLDHGRVALGADGEGVVVGRGDEADDLAAPAELVLCELMDWGMGGNGGRLRR